MQFSSISDALHMAGHGPYVWVSYAVAVIVLVMLYLMPSWRLRSVKSDLLREQRVAEHQAKNTTTSSGAVE